MLVLVLFLETQIFVEKLFDAVNTKSYLPPPEQPSSGSLKVEFFQHQEKDIKKEEVRICVKLYMFFKNIFGVIKLSFFFKFIFSFIYFYLCWESSRPPPGLIISLGVLTELRAYSHTHGYDFLQ